jgi:hypothetical protein
MRTGLASRISNARTMKVYGRCSATLTIHMFSRCSAGRRGCVVPDQSRGGRLPRVSLLYERHFYERH